MKAENKKRRQQQALDLEEEMDYERELKDFHAKWAALAQKLEEPSLVVKKDSAQENTAKNAIIPFEQEIEIGF
jgi:hypothetical protein